MKTNTQLAIALTIALACGISLPLSAQEKPAEEAATTEKPAAKKSAAKAADKGKADAKDKAKDKEKPKAEAGESESTVTVRSTEFDFEETTLQGKMKAPAGMILKGRVQQNKSQMVNLRKNFRDELRKSRSAVRTIKP